MLRTKIKPNTDKTNVKEKTQKTESHKQKLITEFTSFTGLCLRVPLQWVPIQLMVLKWYKMVLETTSATVNIMLYKIFKTLLSKLQSEFKDKES